MSPILDKLAKVLAKAENTDNEHEAAAFLAQAQRMATTHSIDLAIARRHVTKSQQREVPIQKRIDVGEARAMGNARLVTLFLTIARSNDVTCNIARNSTYVIAYGFPSDIEVVETLFLHVAYQMVQAANAYLKGDDWRHERVWSEDKMDTVLLNAKTARLSFYDGFVLRIGGRLEEAKATAEAAIVDAETEVSTSSALVLADKRAEVASFYNEKSTARGSWRGRQRQAPVSHRSAAAGSTAGQKARLTSQRAVTGGHVAING